MIIALSASLVFAALALAMAASKLKALRDDNESFHQQLRKASLDLTYYSKYAERKILEESDLRERLNSAERDVISVNNANRTLVQHNIELACRIQELEAASLENSSLLHIKFTARMPNGDLEKTVFKLGVGPCGLTVKALKWTEYDDHYILEQLCTNGEIKRFKYDREDVLGRIEQRLK
ncbi:hypothetical protein RU59_00004 [Enterobacter phage phiEap-1]|uniref:Fusion protein n=1 Tax=Enterobacter phage phiEap-1 TaxID=1587520 RepID=A0A0K2FGU3_9CAUD|nr:hypothetical protein RU59_00004 [Enterobacter phage phiEap-1]ALA45067.1 hypothetical protein RU59_00004 [Enterobacter phage phiEap-1]